MSVRVEGGVIHLEGACTVEDAEKLCAALDASDAPGNALGRHGGRRVDVSQCRHLHGAVVQALLALRPELVGEPMDGFLKSFVLPALTNTRALDEASARRGAVAIQE